MKKPTIAWLSLLLAVILLTGCVNLNGLARMAQQALGRLDSVKYEDMVYSRPNPAAVEQALAEACQAAAGTDVEQILEKVYAFYDAYDSFYTNYSLADLHYSGDLTDTYWEAEYGSCVENSAAVDAALEKLYYALAASPCRDALESDDYFGPGFFESYDGENLWNDEYTAMLEQEASLENRYYTLAAQAQTGGGDFYENGGNEMIDLLAELIALRQQMAAYWGYDSYVEFAFDSYYSRDYTIGQISDYLGEIRQELVTLYRKLNRSDVWDEGYRPSTEENTFDYVSRMARKMGGTMAQAFDLLRDAGLYDIRYGRNKFDASFEVYLASYGEPFVFMNPSGTVYDCLTFAHEFGHFCNDFASGGSGAGIDVMEVFSQGMEYLSLCYAGQNSGLTRLKMADSLSLYVEQAAFSDFEMGMYGLSGADLCAEGLRALYDQVAQRYGFDSAGYDNREFVTINHFYTSPMYIISYVVSNDAALQLYQMEQDEAGAGLRCLAENLDTPCVYFLEFLDTAGLESPFAPGRIQTVRDTFVEILQ